MESLALKTFSSGEYHYVFGEVYAPLQVDTDGETMAAGDIQKLAHGFIASGKVNSIDIQHSSEPVDGLEVVESFIARKGDPDYREGSWVLGVRMRDGPVWEAVKGGKLNGFSFAAVVKKAHMRVLVELDKIASGETEMSTFDSVASHKHRFYVEVDSGGRVSFGTTSPEAGHFHLIKGASVTETADGHNHRYFME
jgi:hypothetical protein